MPVPEPPAVVATTSLAPAVPAGLVQLRLVAEVTFGEVQAAPPMVTVVAPVTNPVPVTVTLVPPANGPLLGLMPVTVGTAT